MYELKRLPKGWSCNEDGTLHLDAPLFPSFREAIQEFLRLQERGACAVISCYKGEDCYAVYDESPLVETTEAAEQSFIRFGETTSSQNLRENLCYEQCDYCYAKSILARYNN